MKKTVLAFGETLWDLLPGGAVLGGAPFNFAYRVHELGDDAIMVSRLGQDELGDRALETIRALGVDVGQIQRDPDRPTGTVHVTFDESHSPDYHIVPDVAYDSIEVGEDLRKIAETADCVCFGTLIQRSAASRSALEEILGASPRAVRLLDINLRKDCFTPKTIRSSLEAATVLKLNETEAEHLAELFGLPDRSIPGFCRAILDEASLSHCVVTLAERGSVSASREHVIYTPGYRVELVDSCGSGDAFTAGFIHRFLRGASLGECAELGNALGALVAARRGATEPIPPAAVEELLAGDSLRVRDSRFEGLV